MRLLVAFAAADGVDFVDEGDVVKVQFFGVDADHGAYSGHHISRLSGIDWQIPYSSCIRWILLVYLPPRTRSNHAS